MVNPIKVEYYPDGVIKEEIWGIGDHSDGVIRIGYYHSGQIKFRKKMFSSDGSGDPSFVYYYPSGQISCQIWKDAGGNFHRIDGPAYIEYSSDGVVLEENWLIDDFEHRVVYPAIIKWNEQGEIVEFTYYNCGVDITRDVLSYLKQNGLNNPLNISRDHSIIMKMQFW